MSRKPSVATSAVRAPLPSSSAFVATVMPWAKTLTSSGFAPAASSAAETASITPSDWSLGVLGALPVCRRSPTTITASVNVPPTSTPRSIGRDATSRPPPRPRRPHAKAAAGAWRARGGGLRGDRRGHRHDLDLLRLGQVLVRRAVAVGVQRHPLARGAATGRRGALARVAVGVEAGAREALEHLPGRRHVAGDDVPHARPVADVEVGPHVAEERARGAGEVVLVGDEAPNGGLARVKHLFLLLSTPDDVPRELAVDRPTDLIHEPLSFCPRALAPDPLWRGVWGASMKAKTWPVWSSR